MFRPIYPSGNVICIIYSSNNAKFTIADLALRSIGLLRNESYDADLVNGRPVDEATRRVPAVGFEPRVQLARVV